MHFFCIYMTDFDPFGDNLTKTELENFRQEISKYFNETIIDKIDNWDVIVKIDRKGILVFDDLSKGIFQPINIEQIKSFDVLNYENKTGFGNMNVLLFDDSIRTGGQIRTEIDKIRKYNIKSLSVAVILANTNTLEELRNQYTDVEFISCKLFDNADFLTFFGKYMPEYFDYICMPQTKDLKVVEVKFSFKLQKDEIIQLFNTKKSNVDLEENKFEYEDRFKMVLDFSKDEIKEIEEKVIPENINLKLDTCKIRFFVHVSETETKIYIEFIVNPFGDFSNCNEDFEYCRQEHKEKDGPNCLFCSIWNLTNYLENRLKMNLDAQNMFYEYKELPLSFIVYL